jgi:flagellar biosynthetic protein FliR
MIAALALDNADGATLAFAFALVLARSAGALMLLPGLGEAELPPMLRAAVALCLTILIFPSAVPTAAAPSAVGTAAIAIVAEATTGLLLGWIGRLWVQAAAMSAQLAAYLLGLSSMLQPDPALGPQSTALARLFSLAAPVLVLTSGLYRLPVMALHDSYQLAPAGSFFSIAAAGEIGLGSLARAFALAVRMVSPFVLASVLWHVALGLLSRLVPRIQIYFISIPAQILGGTLLLSVITGTMLGALQDALRVALRF